ncbi:head-tail connector protein [Sphingomonas aquatilis]|uniref:head-tail connector protein n=1 Tax=Sphingomonas aquatilis TaxID=93063 RepID=UPI0023FA286C|nr:head-tail connector protein [Sphingomonas aquatilis]MCI4653884.1 head-tail connector protein [Sphingomonas aquatilis]
MTFDIVTLDEVKEYLRVDGDDDDATIALLIAAATEAALRLADSYDPVEEPPASLKLAILVHVARAFANREDAADVPPSAARLLSPLRQMDV